MVFDKNKERKENRRYKLPEFGHSHVETNLWKDKFTPGEIKRREHIWKLCA